jgi:hypothetical protein
MKRLEILRKIAILANDEELGVMLGIKLEKAINPQDFKQNIIDNSKLDTDIIDLNTHFTNPEKPDHLKLLLDDQSEHFNNLADEHASGAAPKTIHSVKNNGIPKTVMVKPYLKSDESDDILMPAKHTYKHPTTGWATMTTHGIFGAAGISHMCENVSAHYVGSTKTPCTIHEFGNNYKEINQADMALKISDLQKIGVMNFLLDNQDQHEGNLLVSRNKPDGQFHQLLSVDHERNLRYTDKQVNWKTYTSNQGGLGKLSAMRGASPQLAEPDLVEWWQNHKHKIANEFRKHISAIKDENLKNHIHDKFFDRMVTIDGVLSPAAEKGSINLMNLRG